jgi:hypothetical protein
MNAHHTMHTPPRRSVMLHDIQLGLALALLVGGAVWLNSVRADAAARAASYRSDAAEARAEYAHHTGVVHTYRQQAERVRQDSAARPHPADSVSRAAASLLKLEEEHAALAATRIPVLAANARAASREATRFAAGMVALLALGVVPVWRWRRVQRRGPQDTRSVGTAG